MPVYGPESGGRTGPYWRRQLGTTLPGERTGPELAQINALRARHGLPPLGGPAGMMAMNHPARPGMMGPPVRTANPYSNVPLPTLLALHGLFQGGMPTGREGLRDMPMPQHPMIPPGLLARLGQQRGIRRRPIGAGISPLRTPIIPSGPRVPIQY